MKRSFPKKIFPVFLTNVSIKAELDSMQTFEKPAKMPSSTDSR